MQNFILKLFVILSVITNTFARHKRIQRVRKQAQVDTIVKDSPPNVVNTKYSFPENLTDGNSDGFADEADFIRSFANLYMSPWELRQLFLMADSNGNGQIDAGEWRNFYQMFILKFQVADADQNLFLNLDEFKKSFEDLPQLQQVVNDNWTFTRLINDISGRQDMVNKTINLFEWMFIRRCGVAWGISNSRQITISKQELLDSAVVIMLPFNPHNSQLKNTIFQSLDFRGTNAQYTFLETVNIFHKFLIFQSMIKHSSIHGSIPIPKLKQCIDDGVGPNDVFIVDGQTKDATIEQAFALRDGSEEIGIDFQTFYTFMNVIYAVKWHGNTTYGTLKYPEYIELISQEYGWDVAYSQMNQSYVMNGDYLRTHNYTLESEAHVLSNGKLNPVQNRFLQIQHPVKKTVINLKHRLSKKSQKQAPAPEKKNFSLAQDPLIYFYNMMTSNSNIELLNYGDLFRIMKYSQVFAAWDNTHNLMVNTIYPETLNYEQVNVLPTVLFLREKEIIRDIVELYKQEKQLDHVKVSLPIDFLGFVRFMAYDQVQMRVTRAKVGEDIAYSSLYNVFLKLGLIPYNLDLNDWLRTIFQGQKGFQIYNQTGDILEIGRQVVDGYEQFKLSQIRNSKQLQSKIQFGSEWAYIDPIQYHSPNHKTQGDLIIGKRRSNRRNRRN